MIPFHKIYAWLFKSFSIGEETKLIDRLIEQGYTKMMIIKRSWVFFLAILVDLKSTPIILLLLSCVSVWIGLFHLPNDTFLRGLVVIGNILMALIFTISTLVYLKHFRAIHKNSHKIVTDIPTMRESLADGDRHFIKFFNWSITNQWILGLILVLEVIFIASHFQRFNGHIMILAIDFFVIIAEIHYLRRFRKRMMDLEMDFNVVVQGKIFFVNQTGLLSDSQTIESDKIKTIKSTFPNKLASFFNFGNIDILTEGDNNLIGTMMMYYVMSPVEVANSIQSLLGEVRSIPPKYRNQIPGNEVVTVTNPELIKKMNAVVEEEKTTLKTIQHDMTELKAMDTRGKVRDILR